MSDEEDYPGKELMQSAKVKLTPEEMNAVLAWAYNTTLEKVNDWICKDMDRIGRKSSSESVLYCRILWLIGQDNEINPQVDEWEASRIQDLRKAHFSIGELARVFQRSKSTIHAHIQGPISHDERRDLESEEIDSVLKR